MRIKSLLIVLLLSVSTIAQNPVEEAKEKRIKAHYEAMVEHAKSLLERKESLEKELAEIDGKLAKLANGHDVPEDGGAVTASAWANCYANGCGALTCPGR